MDNSEIYKSLNEHEGLNLPSFMGIFPRDKNYILLDPERTESLLKNNKEFTVHSFEMAEPGESENHPIANFNFDAEISYEGDKYNASIAVYSTENLALQSYSFANTIDKESLDIAIEQPFYLEVTTRFNEDPMISFLFQLKVLHTLVPDASLVIDFSSLRLLSPYWLKMTAASSIPPSPNYLYTIHAVYDEKENGDMEYWMHTHGLHRCGSMELELVNIKTGAQEMHNLINTAANMFILEHHKENESFQVGYDGLGIYLCWLRWEEALKRFPENILGGKGDREEEDGSYNVHSEPSGILFAVEDSEYTSPEIFVKTLADNPIFLIKTEETLRMSALAKELFHLFNEIYEKHGPQKEEKKGFFKKMFSKEEENPWQFLVKLGLITDNAKDDNGREHLWFDVLSIDGDKITGKLLNQPYWIAKLNEGDINTYPIAEVLTDWIIYGPEASYTPDSIYELYI